MIEIRRVHHIGIRVADAERASAFYRHFGFRTVAEHTADRVVILTNDTGVEINLIVNANAAGEPRNVLMDEPVKHPGYTHVALEIASVEATLAALEAADIAVSEGPVRLGEGLSLFVRDPDRNVIELRQPHL